MAFIQHTNCPKCGSKDNLAEYSDGFYCFGCGYKKQKNEPKIVYLKKFKKNENYNY